MILIQLEGRIQESRFEAVPKSKVMIKIKIKNKIYDANFLIKSFKLESYLNHGSIIKVDGVVDENSKEIKELSNIWIKIK